MPVEAFWDNDNPFILHHRASGNWSLEEYDASIDETVKLMQSVDHEVYILGYIEKTLTPPNGFFLHLGRAVGRVREHPNLKIMVATGGGTVARKVMTMLIKAKGWHKWIILMGTYEEGHKFITKLTADAKLRHL